MANSTLFLIGGVRSTAIQSDYNVFTTDLSSWNRQSDGGSLNSTVALGLPNYNRTNAIVSVVGTKQYIFTYGMEYLEFKKTNAQFISGGMASNVASNQLTFYRPSDAQVWDAAVTSAP